ncbi:MAG: YfiR family protein [Cytophagales bacterium]|nr:YfiR family protein [Cytophagales bacterium]
MKRQFYKIAGILILFGSYGNFAQAQYNIYKLHSLFMYNFTKHIQWTEVGDSFTIGVFGSTSAMQEVKANFSGKKYSGKEIRVINVAGIGDANASQLVYVPKSNKSKILNLFEDVEKNNTLFVSEDDLIEYGIPISFVMKGSKLGFKVSRKNLEVSGLKISSSLLSLAEVVD